MEKTSNVNLPYFDVLIEQLNMGNRDLERVFGKHVHWGYWKEPAQAELSIESFAKAAECLSETMVDLVGVRQGDAILDVGCGFGGTVSLLNEKFDQVSLTGVNIDGRQLERARGRLKAELKTGNDVSFVEANACELPFEDNSFDGALAVECIFHFPSRLQFLAEAYRVLKPGSKLVISDFVLKGSTRLLLALWFVWYFRTFNSLFGDANLNVTTSKYKKLANEVGFKLGPIVDITEGTIPTYDFLMKFASRFPDHTNNVSLTARLLKQASERAWMQYLILVFEKPKQ